VKLRVTEGSVRLRITPSELEALLAGRPVSLRVPLAGGELGAELRPGAARCALRLDGCRVVVELSAAELAALAEPEREGVYLRAGDVRYLVEKDFPCAHPHAPEAAEPEGERFAPTAGYHARKAGAPA
jgi:hypothetical protein